MKMKNVLPVIAACLLVAAPLASAEKIKVLLPAEAVGLDGEPLRMESIPFHDLKSKEDLRARMAEFVAERVRAMEKATGVRALVAEPVIPPDLARALEAVEAGDDDRAREILSDIVGHEVWMPTAEQRRQHDATAVYRTLETRPAAEVLALMRPDRVEALAEYEDILDTRRKVIDALNNDDIDSRTRSALRVFLSKSREPETREAMEARTPPELKEKIRLAQERGWYESPHPARGAALLARASRFDLARSSLSAYARRPEAASFAFDLPGPGDPRLEVLADTIFGGVLYAEKSEADAVITNDPNLHILGHEGSVSTRRHSDGVWATAVTAFDGSHKYKVTVESSHKLEGEERAEFVRMATAMIEEDLSIPRDAPSSQAAY